MLPSAHGLMLSVGATKVRMNISRTEPDRVAQSVAAYLDLLFQPRRRPQAHVCCPSSHTNIPDARLCHAVSSSSSSSAYLLSSHFCQCLCPLRSRSPWIPRASHRAPTTFYLALDLSNRSIPFASPGALSCTKPQSTQFHQVSRYFLFPKI